VVGIERDGYWYRSYRFQGATRALGDGNQNQNPKSNSDTTSARLERYQNIQSSFVGPTRRRIHVGKERGCKLCAMEGSCDFCPTQRTQNEGGDVASEAECASAGGFGRDNQAKDGGVRYHAEEVKDTSEMNT
jgi:hypothetical protein